jgi:hypothetical protein
MNNPYNIAFTYFAVAGGGSEFNQREEIDSGHRVICSMVLCLVYRDL